MKLTAILSGAFALAAELATSHPVPDEHIIVKSEPFNIIILSANPAYDGTYLVRLRSEPGLYANQTTFRNTIDTPYYFNST